jgi:hypothetical protein
VALPARRAPGRPTPLDHQALADFPGYEASHGRRVDVVAGPALGGLADARQRAL